MKVTSLDRSFRDVVVDIAALDDLPDDWIAVETRLCGICWSDIKAATGEEPFVGPHMFGHEGLGVVTSSKADVPVGCIVATAWHPAYAELYPCPSELAVIVPEVSPVYILQPVACILLAHMVAPAGRTVIIGSGFMAILAHLLRPDAHVVGTHNQQFFDGALLAPEEAAAILTQAKVVLLTNGKRAQLLRYVRPGSTIVAVDPPATLDGFRCSWQAADWLFPSPRHPLFPTALQRAVDFASTYQDILAKLWNREYGRSSAPTAFAELGYDRRDAIRGYFRFN